MKKFCVIVIWYGQLPEYFEYWEISAAANYMYADFKIVTDQKFVSSYENIQVMNIPLCDLEKKISCSLNVDTRINKPFKICDFRPAFGIVFADELKEYEYWGHCDLDQVFGDLGIIARQIADKQYEKIGRSGHLTLYKNNEKINKLFMQNGALFDYKRVFSSDENFAFDELTGICRIAKHNSISYLSIVDMRADIDVKSRRMDINNNRNYQQQLFLWKEGHLYRYYLKNGKIEIEEFVYLHFQKKRPIANKMNRKKMFVIGRECFTELNTDITYEDFDIYNCVDSKIIRRFYVMKYYLNKMLQFVKCSPEQRKIWIAQKAIGNEKYE